MAAAHEVLVTYVPSAQANLNAAYAASLAQIPDGKAKAQGIAFGIRAADHLIRLRAHDGRNNRASSSPGRRRLACGVRPRRRTCRCRPPGSAS